MSQTFVLVHGAWHGGWCWRFVADRLRGAGHRVFAPTLTGLGQSRHLLSGAITLDIMVADVAGSIETEELENVVLVGHSFGGVVVSGVADRRPEHLAVLVFLDSLFVENGRSPLDMAAPERAAARRRLVAEEGHGLVIPPPSPAALGIPDDHPQAAWVRRRLTPHPVASYESPLVLRHALGNGLPCVCIECTSPLFAGLEGARDLARRQPGRMFQFMLLPIIWIYQERCTV